MNRLIKMGLVTGGLFLLAAIAGNAFGRSQQHKNKNIFSEDVNTNLQAETQPVVIDEARGRLTNQLDQLKRGIPEESDDLGKQSGPVDHEEINIPEVDSSSEIHESVKIQQEIDQLAELLEKHKAVERENAALKDQVTKLNQQLGNTPALNGGDVVEVGKLNQSNAYVKQLLDLNKSLEDQLNQAKKVVEEKTSLIDRLTQVGLEFKRKYIDQQKQGQDLNRQLSKILNDNKECRNSLEQSFSLQQTVKDYQRQLLEAHNALLLKETEINALRGGGSNLEKSKTMGQDKGLSSAQVAHSEPVRQINVAQPAAQTHNDVLIVRVTAAKVNLRSGPGDQHSPLMQVGENTRLTVEAREGEWLRVYAPTGGRAYIKADVVTPVAQDQAPSQAGSTGSVTTQGRLVPFGRARIGGRTKSGSLVSVVDEDDRAFETLKSGMSDLGK